MNFSVLISCVISCLASILYFIMNHMNMFYCSKQYRSKVIYYISVWEAVSCSDVTCTLYRRYAPQVIHYSWYLFIHNKLYISSHVTKIEPISLSKLPNFCSFLI